MRRRILRVALIAAAVAIVLFGVPLVIVAQQLGILDERGEAERFAASAALRLTVSQLAGEAVMLPAVEAGTQIALYGPNNDKLRGDGPARADDTAVQAQQKQDLVSVEADGSFIVAVPVASTDGATQILWTSSPNPLISTQLVSLVAGMLALSLFALGVAAAFAARQARRLAAPLEWVADSADRLGHGDFTVVHHAAGVAEIDQVGAALQETATRLETILSRERAFSADASHQLRTPLTRLRLSLEHAVGAGEGDAQEAIRVAMSQSDALERVIHDLLSLARDLPADATATDLGSVLTTVTAPVRLPLAEQGRQLRTEPPPRDATVVTAARRTAVEQILQVLLDNAVAHGRGTVTVTVRSSRGTSIVDVRDEGTGPTIEQEVLFARRPRTDGSSDRHGIGLALARSLAEAEGGRLIFAGYTPDRGTVFSVFLPPAVRRDAPPEGA